MSASISSCTAVPTCKYMHMHSNVKKQMYSDVRICGKQARNISSELHNWPSKRGSTEKVIDCN